MKKLFIVLAVASLGFVACNNDAEKTETIDSIQIKATQDSLANAARNQAANDSLNALATDSLGAAAKDSIK
jgi:hypothetical protein